ncbi:MAG: hypothetical protein H0T78_10745 [Longispora sp.]|nr:hypothetical protein [Longispora sp. (in: high G+C Gram-positive bacteria)]
MMSMSPNTRAEAIFASLLQPSEHLTRAEVNAAILASLRTYGGPRGCAAVMAVEYGDHPEVAARRMRWALELCMS